MKRVLLILLLLAGLATLAYVMLRGFNPGYVLIYVGGYSFETTLAALVLAVVALVVTINVLFWLVRTLNPLRLRNTRFLRRFFAPHDPLAATQQGMQDLLLGNWQQAYRLLVENADKVQNPGMNYLAAAIAAFQRGDRPGWSFCLDRAEKKSGVHAMGVRSLRALLESRSGERQQALSLLQGLQRVIPNQPFVLTQLAEIYRATGDWNTLEQMLPDMERRHVLAPEALLALQDQVYQHQLQQAGSESEQSLQYCWKKMPKALRAHAHITGAYIQQLLRVGQDAEAASMLTSFLKKSWSDEIVALVAQLDNGKPQQQLALLENCLKQHPDNPVLLTTLGRVSVRNQLWRKARDYFEKALQLATTAQQSAQICTELAKLLEQLGERDKSLQYYQRAVQMLEQ